MELCLHPCPAKVAVLIFTALLPQPYRIAQTNPTIPDTVLDDWSKCGHDSRARRRESHERTHHHRFCTNEPERPRTPAAPSDSHERTQDQPPTLAPTSGFPAFAEDDGSVAAVAWSKARSATFRTNEPEPRLCTNEPDKPSPALEDRFEPTHDVPAQQRESHERTLSGCAVVFVGCPGTPRRPWAPDRRSKRTRGLSPRLRACLRMRCRVNLAVIRGRDVDPAEWWPDGRDRPQEPVGESSSWQDKGWSLSSGQPGRRHRQPPAAPHRPLSTSSDAL